MSSVLDRSHTIAPPGYNRFAVPPAALAVHLSIGQVYAFSTFNLPLTRLIGISESAFEMMKKHIRSTHIHDNNKDRDAHLLPGEGSINWGEAMQLLRTAPQVPPLLMEIEGDGKNDVPEAMATAFRKMSEAEAAVAK